jgi:hypothetical protein
MFVEFNFDIIFKNTNFLVNVAIYFRSGGTVVKLDFNIKLFGKKVFSY